MVHDITTDFDHKFRRYLCYVHELTDYHHLEPLSCPRVLSVSLIPITGRLRYDGGTTDGLKKDPSGVRQI